MTEPIYLVIAIDVTDPPGNRTEHFGPHFGLHFHTLCAYANQERAEQRAEHERKYSPDVTFVVTEVPFNHSKL